MNVQASDHSNSPIDRLGVRIEELNNKSTQVLLFLTFGIAAAALLWSTKDNPMTDTQKNLLLGAMRSWVWAIFPTAVGILPVKEACEDNLCWYRIVRWFKALLLWAAIAFIIWGAVDFARAL